MDIYFKKVLHIVLDGDIQITQLFVKQSLVRHLHTLLLCCKSSYRTTHCQKSYWNPSSFPHKDMIQRPLILIPGSHPHNPALQSVSTPFFHIVSFQRSTCHSIDPFNDWSLFSMTKHNFQTKKKDKSLATEFHTLQVVMVVYYSFEYPRCSLY